MNQLNEEQVRQNAKVLGWLYIAGNALVAVLGIFVFVLLLGVGAFTDDPTAFGILGVTGGTVGGLLVLLGVPGIAAGIGLLLHKSWGRILALVVGFLGLLNFPVGTAIGIYAFWVLMQESAAGVFGRCCEG